MKKMSMGQGKKEKEKESAEKVERYDAPVPQAGPSQASKGHGGETKVQNDKGKDLADPDDPKKVLDPRRRSHGGPRETFTETGGGKCRTLREGKGGSHGTPGETSTEMRGGDRGPGEGKERGERGEVETDNAREHYTVVGDALPEVRGRGEGR